MYGMAKPGAEWRPGDRAWVSISEPVMTPHDPKSFACEGVYTFHEYKATIVRINECGFCLRRRVKGNPLIPPLTPDEKDQCCCYIKVAFDRTRWYHLWRPRRSLSSHALRELSPLEHLAEI